MDSQTVKLKELQGRNLGHLLFETARLLDESAQMQVNLEAGQRVARPALMRLLPHLDFDGIRPTALAKKVDISKQAVGKLLEAMKTQGLVEFVPDPSDKRAFLVRLTPHGGAAFRHGLGVLSKLEKRLCEVLGNEHIEQLHTMLRDVHEVLLQWRKER